MTRKNAKMTAKVNSILLIVALTAVTASAQTTIEDFNTDGDGTRYTLTGAGIDDRDTLFQVNLPSFFPVINPALVVVPAGAALGHDEAGNLAPAARFGIFFNDNQDPRVLTPAAIALYDETVKFAAPGGTNAVFVVSDGGLRPGQNPPTIPAGEQTDVYLFDRLSSTLGYTTVTLVDDDDVAGTHYSLDGVDLIVVSDDISSGDIVNLGNPAIPIINYEPSAYDILGIANDAGTQTVTTLNVVDAAHPIAIAAGLSAGPFSAATGTYAFHDIGADVAPGANVIVEFPAGVDPFDGEEGSNYLLGADLNKAFGGGPPRLVDLNPIDTSGNANPKIVVALAADGDTELADDFIRILIDPENDGTFNLLAEAKGEGGMVLDGVPLSATFQDFIFDVPSSPNLVIRFDVFTTADSEQIGIDNIRLLPVPDGDFNADGTTDLLDFQILLMNFGIGTTYAEGDNNFDGRVDLHDFVEFRELFNAPAATAVPEPNGLALGLVSATLLLVTRRRKIRA